MRNPEARPRRRRIAAVVIITALFLGGGGAAYAYWTTTGSGSGTVTAGSPQCGHDQRKPRRRELWFRVARG